MRFITDNPKANTETMLNYAYVKDGEVYLRDGTPNGKKLCDFIYENSRKVCEIEKASMSEGICAECFMDGSACIFAILAVLATQAAELREKLKILEDRATPMEVTETHIDEYYCPACGAEQGCYNHKVEDKYCSNCGQALVCSDTR